MFKRADTEVARISLCWLMNQHKEIQMWSTLLLGLIIGYLFILQYFNVTLWVIEMESWLGSIYIRFAITLYAMNAMGFQSQRVIVLNNN